MPINSEPVNSVPINSVPINSVPINSVPINSVPINSELIDMPAPYVSCGVLVVRGDPVESFLLMMHPDRLDLPKGHIEPGESELACALRELEEETGITAEDIELFPDFRFTTSYQVRYKDVGDHPLPKTTVIFLAALRRDVEIHVTEHLGYRWWPWHPPHKIQAETIDPLLAQVAQYLQAAAGT